MISYDLELLRRKIAKLFVIRASGYALDSQRKYPLWELANKDLQRLLEQGVGGVILYGGTVEEIKSRTSVLNGWAEESIFLCADVEEGVGQRFEGGTSLLPPMSIGRGYAHHPKESILLAEEYGKCIGQQAKECGLNLVFAPVCDVNSNQTNPVINMRAWGEDPKVVADLVCAFHKGVSAQGVLDCAKHFPGHGDTSVDSHLDLPVLDHELNRLRNFELIPFKELISHGVNAVMTAHLLLKNIDANNIATFSERLLTDLLRKEIGFQGLVFTDALVMKAITNIFSSGESAIRALAAGADVILMPEKIDEAIDAVQAAVLSGRLSIDCLQASLDRRSHAMKQLETFRKDNCKEFDRYQFDSEHAQGLSKKLIEFSIHRSNSRKLQSSSKAINLIRTDNIFASNYLHASSPALLIPEAFGYRNTIINSLGVSPWQPNLLEPFNLNLFDSGPFLIQIFMRGNPFRGDIDANEPWKAALNQLQNQKRLAGLIVYGSIYVWNDLSSVVDSSIPAAYSPGQIDLAQEKILIDLFGSSKPITGSFSSIQSEFTK